jgi:hypothetical protein
MRSVEDINRDGGVGVQQRTRIRVISEEEKIADAHRELMKLKIGFGEIAEYWWNLLILKGLFSVDPRLKEMW